MAELPHELFLLRIWAEAREVEGQSSVYRGRVEHIRSKRTTYLRQLEQLVPFMRRCLDEVGELPPGDFDQEGPQPAPPQEEVTDEHGELPGDRSHL